MKHNEEEKTMSQNRRQFLGTAGAGAAAVGLTALGFPALAQAPTKIRVGYLHTLAVDGQMWLADHLGSWKKNGLEPEFRSSPRPRALPGDGGRQHRHALDGGR